MSGLLFCTEVACCFFSGSSGRYDSYEGGARSEYKSKCMVGGWMPASRQVSIISVMKSSCIRQYSLHVKRSATEPVLNSFVRSAWGVHTGCQWKPLMWSKCSKYATNSNKVTEFLKNGPYSTQLNQQKPDYWMTRNMMKQIISLTREEFLQWKEFRNILEIEIRCWIACSSIYLASLR